MFSYKKYQSKLLKQYIASFYVYHFDADVDIQLFPKGVFEIVFQSNNNFQHNTAYSSGWELRPNSFIGGLHNKSYYVKSNEKSSFCIAVEFKANTAKHFIPYNLNDFQNNLVDIYDVWGREAEVLSDKINATHNDLDKISLIEYFLLGKVKEHNSSKIDNALNLIINSQGFVEASKLAKDIGLSDAQFRKRFKEEIGISPSQYCKIVRINTTLEYLKVNNSQSLSELSHELGYFDQSHFIKDFKSVSGFSPSNYRQNS